MHYYDNGDNNHNNVNNTVLDNFDDDGHDNEDDGDDDHTYTIVLIFFSIERDTKSVYMVPAFELKSGSNGNDALLPSEWRGVMRGLQQVLYPPL